MRILILGAFEKELAGITQKLPDLKEVIIAKRRCKITKWNHHDIAFSLSGLGTTAAASNTTALCEIFDPQLIVLCGVAGGLNADQQIGDFVFADKIIDADLYKLENMLHGTPYEQCLIDPHTLEATTREYIVQPSLIDIGLLVQIDRIKKGSIVTSNLFPAPKEFFNEIKKLGCSAIEMESVGVFQAAKYYDIPVISVRAISNLLNSSGDDLGTGSDALTICSERISMYLLALFTHIPALETATKAIRQKRISESNINSTLKSTALNGLFFNKIALQNEVKENPIYLSSKL